VCAELAPLAAMQPSASNPNKAAFLIFASRIS